MEFNPGWEKILDWTEKSQIFEVTPKPTEME